MRLLRSCLCAIMFAASLSLTLTSPVSHASCHHSHSKKHYKHQHYQKQCHQCATCCNYAACLPEPVYGCQTEYSYHHGVNKAKVEVCEVVSYTCSNWMYAPYQCY